MRKTVYLFVALLFTISLGCHPNNSKATAAVADQGNKPTVVAEDVTVEKAKQMKADPTIVFLDVRTLDEVNQGAVEGSVNVDYYENFEAEVSKLDKNKTYVVYCAKGGRSKSAQSDMVEKLGFTKVYNMLGGYEAWSSK